MADKVHRQGEHIPQHCHISHNHPYVSSSEFVVFLKNEFEKIVMRCHTCGWCVNLWLMHHPILAHASTNGVQWLVHSAPSVFPTKKSQEWGRSYAQNKAQKDYHTHHKIPGYWWLFFEHNTYHVTVLGCLKKERKKKMKNSDFRP